MMRWTLIAAAAATLTLAGCKDHETETQLADARTQLAGLRAAEADLTAELDDATLAAQQARAELAAREADLARARADLQAAQDRQVAEAPEAELATLRAEVEKLRAEVAALKQAAEAPPEPAPQPEAQPAPATGAADDALARVQANPADVSAQRELTAAMRAADKATRAAVIDKLKALVAADPENKQLRLTLARNMSERFRDIANPMDQGQLAADIKAEINKVLAVDPDYYDAVHMMAVMKSNYPPFTEEFKTANADLDRALKLQADMTWEDRFGEIYVCYSRWHRAQGKLAEAEAVLQGGLDKAPRDALMLAEKERIAQARQGE